MQPFELIYFKSNDLGDVVNGVVNQLIENKSIIVYSDRTIELSDTITTNSKEENQTVDLLKTTGKADYRMIRNYLKAKPVFSNNAICMDALLKYFHKSQKFCNLFYLNFCALAVLLMLGVIRLVSGITRQKPIVLIFIVILFLFIIISECLKRLPKMVNKHTISNIYKKNHVLPILNDDANWQWRYYLLGTSIFSTSFVPLTKYINKYYCPVNAIFGLKLGVQFF